MSIPEITLVYFPLLDTLIILLLTTLAAEDWAHALAAIFATETRVTLAMTQQTFALPAATVRTIVRHVLRDYSYERHLLRIPVVVVQRKEPMARLHVVRHFLLDRWLDERNRRILTTLTF